MTEFLDLIFDDPIYYRECLKYLKGLILSEIFTRFKLRIKPSNINFKKEQNSNYFAQIEGKKYRILINVDDYNINIAKLHDINEQEWDIRLKLSFRQFMNDIFKDFKYKQELRKFIIKNYHEELGILPYLQEQIDETNKCDPNQYNLDMNTKNKDYLTYLSKEMAFYQNALTYKANSKEQTK